MKAFECRMCGACCFGEGGISISPGEIAKIAGFLGEGPEAFVSRAGEIRHGKPYIRTGEDGFCLFHNKDGGCMIHPVKPRVCSLWPFYPAILKDRDHWEMLKDACPGFNPEASFRDFQLQSKDKLEARRDLGEL